MVFPGRYMRSKGKKNDWWEFLDAAQLVEQWNAETEKWLFVHVILQLLNNYIPLFYSLFTFVAICTSGMWKITARATNKVCVFNFHCFRSILDISRHDHFTNNK